MHLVIADEMKGMIGYDMMRVTLIPACSQKGILYRKKKKKKDGTG